MRGPGANLKTQYAVQAVLFLAGRDRPLVVPVSQMSVELGISPKFLEDILAALRAAGIVLSRRGKEGGYQLVPDPADLTVLQIVEALEGPMDAPMQDESSALVRVTAEAFAGAWEAAAEYLGGVTVEQLLDLSRRLDAEQAAPYMYYL